jgi:MFS family permease
MLYAFVFFFGIFNGGRISSLLGMLGEFFGMRALGELIGITMALGMAMGAVAPYIAGFIFDTTGSYFTAFMIVLALLVASGVLAAYVKKPVLEER